MLKFQFNEKKAIAALLYILEKVGKADFHKIFKLIYFAEQKHLAEFGRPITGDNYIAMRYGPVPSIVYDILEAVKKDYGYCIDPAKFNAFFVIEAVGKIYFVEGKVKANLDFLSQSELVCLSRSIEENKDLNFDALTRKSHDFAWENTSGDQEMSMLDIAYAVGANDEMLKYIILLSENENMVLA